MTGNYLAGRSGVAIPDQRRPHNHGVIQLTGAAGHNLQSITVDFPLGVLCVVAGVSGAGKSTLARRTLFPAIAQRKGVSAPTPLPYDNVLGVGQIDEMVLVERKVLGR